MINLKSGYMILNKLLNIFFVVLFFSFGIGALCACNAGPENSQKYDYILYYADKRVGLWMETDDAKDEQKNCVVSFDFFQKERLIRTGSFCMSKKTDCPLIMAWSSGNLEMVFDGRNVFFQREMLTLVLDLFAGKHQTFRDYSKCEPIYQGERSPSGRYFIARYQYSEVRDPENVLIDYITGEPFSLGFDSLYSYSFIDDNHILAYSRFLPYQILSYDDDWEPHYLGGLEEENWINIGFQIQENKIFIARFRCSDNGETAGDIFIYILTFDEQIIDIINTEKKIPWPSKFVGEKPLFVLENDELSIIWETENYIDGNWSVKQEEIWRKTYH